MCGIAGAFFLQKERAFTPDVKAMLLAMDHRGPDSTNVIEMADGLLGANRLAIVDVEGGANPHWDATESVAVALNGEVYNNAPLRIELFGREVEFKGTCDTEVVANLFARNPHKALSRLRGMFALAAWNKTGCLRLVRDRIGQKPLYWTVVKNTLLFASELQGLLVVPEVNREIDPDALSEYLLFEYVPSPRTIYKGIQKLEPGTELITTPPSEISDGTFRIQRWWNPPVPSIETDTRPASTVQSTLWGALDIAVKHRMNCELPVAWMISGGLDSTAIGVLGAQRSKEPLPTFSMGFDHTSFDETESANTVARLLRSHHTALKFGSSDLESTMAEITTKMGEPLSDSSLPATWLLSKAISTAGFKVAMSGDGADEHLGGYPTYFAHQLADKVSAGKGVIGRFAKMLPASTDNLSRGYKARRFSHGLDQPLHRRNQIWLGAFLPNELTELGVSGSPWATVDRWGEIAATASSSGQGAMFLDQRLYLADGVLTKVDRASMAHSLEVRSPFLDHQLIEFIARLPKSSLWRGTNTKVILRKMLKKHAPKAIVNRPKKGFGTPVGAYLAGPLSGMLESLPDQLEGLIKTEFIIRLTSEHISGHRDHRRRLWTLITLAMWYRGPWGPKG
jgi:asparagine synthase (glutamine-hydrolysing)